MRVRRGRHAEHRCRVLDLLVQEQHGLVVATFIDQRPDQFAAERLRARVRRAARDEGAFDRSLERGHQAVVVEVTHRDRQILERLEVGKRARVCLRFGRGDWSAAA